MASTEQVVESILELLSGEAEGLEIAQIVRQLLEIYDDLSPRGVRNLVNEMADDGRVVKLRRSALGPGAPPFAYYHQDRVPRQLSLFEALNGVAQVNVTSKSKIELEELLPEDRERIYNARSVLGNIASSHINQDHFARAIIEIAPTLGEENPTELILGMTQWVVGNLNDLGLEMRRSFQTGKLKEADALARTLEHRLTWAKQYLQRLWRFDRPTAGLAGGILDLPSRPREFIEGEEITISFNVEAARTRLAKRIIGGKLFELRKTSPDLHKSAAGTDASVADIYLDHSQGSFIPPDPISVMTAAASQITRLDGAAYEFQDFDIFPDELRQYEDYMAAVEGLVISPLLRQILPERDFKHTRSAAMELRQYTEDIRVILRQARWRPIGQSVALGIIPKTTLLIRDGRLFPLVHRINDYEADGLYGSIVRREIEAFSYVVHNALAGPGGPIVYGAAVKSPQMSWLAPLVFWYLHDKEYKIDGQVVVSDDDIFRVPFNDTAISHLLFLGKAKTVEDFEQGYSFVTCRVIRRFSDIAFASEGSITIRLNDGGIRAVNEDDEDDWLEFFRQRVADKRERYEEVILEANDYQHFLYLCAHIGVAMFYAAPLVVYEPLVREDGEGAHFLLPRLETAVDLQRFDRSTDQCLEGILSWLTYGGWDQDHAHTQLEFDTGNTGDKGMPILVPDVLVLAHEAVTFARSLLGEEVEDEIRMLVSELRRRLRH